MGAIVLIVSPFRPAPRRPLKCCAAISAAKAYTLAKLISAIGKVWPFASRPAGRRDRIGDFVPLVCACVAKLHRFPAVPVRRRISCAQASAHSASSIIFRPAEAQAGNSATGASARRQPRLWSARRVARRRPPPLTCVCATVHSRPAPIVCYKLRRRRPRCSTGAHRTVQIRAATLMQIGGLRAQKASEPDRVYRRAGALRNIGVYGERNGGANKWRDGYWLA